MEVSSDERFAGCLAHIAGKFDGCNITEHGRVVLTLPDSTDDNKLFDAVVYQIITVMKTRYIEENILIKDKTLVKVLACYDNKSDLIIASTLVQITPVMLLDGIYDFRLGVLKKRWDGVIALVNDNAQSLVCKGLCNELLRFLIQNMEHKTDEAHIIMNGSTVSVCNNRLVPFEGAGADIVGTLIDIAPRQVFIHLDGSGEKALVKNIETIFPNCVTIEHANS